jgi:hypothetical protein
VEVTGKPLRFVGTSHDDLKAPDAARLANLSMRCGEIVAVLGIGGSPRVLFSKPCERK